MSVRILPYVLVLMATLGVSHHPFFWDTIQLASKHAHFYYENNFSSLLLPNEIDSGHLPAFGMYIAAMWKLFGKSLPVSHFAMLPFLLGIVFFLTKIGDKLAGRRWGPWLALLCLADPVLAGQAVLVSPDVALVCFFLMALWAIWEKKSKAWLVFAVAGLGMVSMRGMMLGVALYAFYVFTSFNKKDGLRVPARKILPFLPGGLLALAFLFYHWRMTGWIGYHTGSAWAPSFERVGFYGFAKNIGILTWRVLDFGRVFLVLGLTVVFLLNWRGFSRCKNELRKLNSDDLLAQLLALLLFTTLAIIPPLVLYKGLLGHRYLLPVFLAVSFLFFHTVQRLAKYRRVLFVAVFIGLASGNFWVYPKKIAMGWDSTLAHLPWYGLQAKMENYILSKGIAYDEIGTAFPNIGPREDRALNGVGDGFHQKNLDQDCYVFYSNVMNDFSDKEIDHLESEWEEVTRMEGGGVCVILYKKPAPCEN
ncbi:MAG: ArnT family glycosyltransferase [Saprospiraceae bacterium]